MRRPPQADRKWPGCRSICCCGSTPIVLVCVFGMILWLVLNTFEAGHRIWWSSHRRIPHPVRHDHHRGQFAAVVLAAAGCLASLVLAVVLVPVTVKMSHHSIWSHPHFSGATLAQFFYVAAQAGIFSFVINYMVWEVPPLPASWQRVRRPGGGADTETARSGEAEGEDKESLIEVKTRIDKSDIKDLPSLVDQIEAEGGPRVGVRQQPAVRRYRPGAWRRTTATASDYALRFNLARDLDDLVTRDTRSAKKKKPTLYDEARFSGIRCRNRRGNCSPRTRRAMDRCRLNRMLLADAYPEELPFQDGILCFSNRAASFLATLGFICFLTGRFTGAGLLRKVSAHKIVGLYGMLNVLMCFLIFLKLGWLSVVCVFLSYFFMSIMFPTIFALGIFGLGERAKGASAFIVMAIMGGAMLPKVMGAVADRYDMSRGFIVPMACFVVVALYGYGWPLLSKADSLHGIKTSGH